MKIFLSPHNDDEALFGSFTIQRELPHIVVVTDGARHAKRYGIPVQTRRMESEAAALIMGTTVSFWGIPDDEIDADILEAKMREFDTDPVIANLGGVERVYAPTFYLSGNPDHNVVGQCASRAFGNRVVWYSTYTKETPKIPGRTEIVPTEHELMVKRNALKCYASQWPINKIYFDAAWSGSEYLD